MDTIYLWGSIFFDVITGKTGDISWQQKVEIAYKKEIKAIPLFFYFPAPVVYQLSSRKICPLLE